MRCVAKSVPLCFLDPTWVLWKCASRIVYVRVRRCLCIVFVIVSAMSRPRYEVRRLVAECSLYFSISCPPLC